VFEVHKKKKAAQKVEADVREAALRKQAALTEWSDQVVELRRR
jgi:hypothetical protein